MVGFNRQHRLNSPPANAADHQKPGSRDEGAWGEEFGTIWVVVGVVSYVTLSLLARAALHSPEALQQLQAEVPAHVYDRSLFVFGTAFLLDVLGLLFELKISRINVVLLPAFVKGAATLTNALVRSGWGTVAFSTGGRVVMVQRLVCWLHTTPTLLVLVKIMAANITRQQVTRAVVCVEVMCLTGLASSLSEGWWRVFWGCLSHLAFLPVLPYLHQGLKEASAVVSLRAARPTMTIVYCLTMLMWISFGVVWDLRAFGLIDLHTEEVAYLCCDFTAKVMFSAGLMLSSFKGLDSRREGVMRQIQEAHKQTLISELRRAIEQKDAFMSSVSHELRTPLNGIIGISEGLLANCCGPLSESVRKQLFIVRTSGARLLALINDVMDAATLRQRRLVLKQEQLQLRQVVGDVVDLTRSLVDVDVSLRNDVPEGLEVWADSGRIVQVLNNLLGNAAKFTHHGFIRVSAQWHDEQRQWLAIHVTDTGIGIPKQKLQSIFLPFEQVDGSISRQYGGFGLGLSITQELVKAHGGELWVKSKEHKGSQFAFTIPSYTGQKPLTPQQVQQLQSKRSMLLPRAALRSGGVSDSASSGAAAAAAADLSRRMSSSQGLLPAVSPTAAAAAGGDGSHAVAPVSSTTKDLAALQPNGTVAAAAAATLEPLGAPSSPGGAVGAGSRSSGPLIGDEELGNSCVVEEEYDARELPYDAAQLSALASSKPYTTHPSSATGSSLSGSLQGITSRGIQHSNSMLSLTGAAIEDEDGLDITLVPNRDQRPSQFACTGRYQVLSVDDDPVNQTVVRSLLASTGYEVVCLYSGQQMLEYIESAEVLPDLVLLDMLMPDMSGPDVCRQLALRKPPLGVPIILVSALAEESSVVTGLDSGADDYITKPFRRAEFLARIRGKLQLTKAGEAAGEQQGRQASAPSGGTSGSEQPVVMCVTDDEVNHMVLEGMLQSQNYGYQKVATGEDALKLLEAAGSAPPHLVLLDAALADTTGLEVLQNLRLRYSQVALPVIMLTARHNEKAIVQALDAGANDYAVKPFRRSELLARIRMHLRSSQKAAAAVSPTERPSAELSFAGEFDNEDLSTELQRHVGLQQLTSVPLMVVQLGGVAEALAGASAEQACQLMGFIADCFDAIVEKYAVIKVDSSDTSLAVAAPLSNASNQSSARNSLQLPLVHLSTPGDSNVSTHLAGTVPEAAAQQQLNGRPTGSSDAAAARGASLPVRPALATAVLQLLQMAQELQACLGVDSPGSSSSSGSVSPAPAQRDAGHTRPASASSAAGGANHRQQPVSCFANPAVQQQGGEDAGRARPRTPLQLLQQQPWQWWHGQLQVQVCVHVGPLTAGVVGRRRPRYRLMGPALQDCRQACAAAPANRPAATASAAQLLQSGGFLGLQPLTGGRSGTAKQQLWVLSAGAPVTMAQHMAVGGGSALGAGGSAVGLLSQAAAALAAGAVPTAVKPGGGDGLLQLGSPWSSSDELPASPSAANGTVPQPLSRPAAVGANQQQQGQHQRPLHHSAAGAAAVAGAAMGQLPGGILPILPPGGMLPMLPPLLDPAVQQSQQLLLQELALLQQQLAAAATQVPATAAPPGSLLQQPPSILGQLPAGLSVPWGQGGLVNGLLQPAALSGLASSGAGSTFPGIRPVAVAAACGVEADEGNTPAAAPAAEAVSPSLSLYEWQCSPTSSPPPHQVAAVPDSGEGGRTALAGSQAPAAVSAGLMGVPGVDSYVAVVPPVDATCREPAAMIGLQLGAAELQQVSLLQQELAAFQQHLLTALGCSSLNGYSPLNGCSPVECTHAQHVAACNGVRQPQVLSMQQQHNGLQQQVMGQGYRSSGDNSSMMHSACESSVQSAAAAAAPAAVTVETASGTSSVPSGAGAAPVGPSADNGLRPSPGSSIGRTSSAGSTAGGGGVSALGQSAGSRSRSRGPFLSLFSRKRSAKKQQ